MVSIEQWRLRSASAHRCILANRRQRSRAWNVAMRAIRTGRSGHDCWWPQKLMSAGTHLIAVQWRRPALFEGTQTRTLQLDARAGGKYFIMIAQQIPPSGEPSLGLAIWLLDDEQTQAIKVQDKKFVAPGAEALSP